MKKQKPKERVLETASKLFREQGYNSTGINQIVSESKVAKASFYDHFKSKDALATAYLHQRHILWFEGLKEFVNKVKPPKEKILQSFEYLKFINDKEDFSGCAFLNLLSELKHENEEVYQIIKNHKQDLQDFFTQIIEDKAKSFQIYMLFEACLTESQVYRSQNIIDKTIEILKSNIL